MDKRATMKILTLLLLLFTTTAWANISQPTVIVNPNQTNNFARYTISSSTGNGNTNLVANVDVINIVFNASTNVPNNISPSLITVNNTTVNSVTVTGQQVAIVTPVNVARNGGPFTVVIDAAAKIKNPLTEGSYTLQASTSKETTLVTSGTYSIIQSASSVTPAAVTPNPSVAGASAAYTIGFNAGTGGSMNAGEGVITMAFPGGTVVPNGALSGVTLNSTAASATGDGDTTVIVTTPVDIENEESVQIVMALGTGLKNPAIDSTYTLDVKTSSEPTWVESDQYIISPEDALSISAITTKPDTVNQAGTFEFEFITGSFGAMTANNDSIFVIFAQNTYLPDNIIPSNVSVTSGGFTDNAAAVTVLNNTIADDDTVIIKTPLNIGNSSNVSVSFNASAGYLNPSVAGNYTLKMKTTKDTSTVSSNPFSIYNTTTTVSQAVVTPANNSTGTATSYTVDFNLGSLGRLKPGESTITLTFAGNYGINADTSIYDNTRISISGGGYIPIPTTSINPSGTTITITIPDNIITGNGDNISLIIDGDGVTLPITNPTSQGNYVLGVKTSVEATNVNSSTYNIGGSAVTINSVTLSTSAVNTQAQYTFNITTTQQLRANPQNDNIKIIFPPGTDLAATIPANTVQIAGTNASAVVVNQANRSVTATVGQVVNPGTFNVVIQTQTAPNYNIRNPIIPSTTFYKVTINTSRDLAPVTSTAYAITSGNTQVSAVSASANPSVAGATSSSAYTVNFTTSATGKIAGGQAAGSSTINIILANTTIPSSIPAGAAEVNGVPSSNISVVTPGLGGELSVTMPNGLTIGNSSAVTVEFDTSAGLLNGTPDGSYAVQVRTLSDNVQASGSYTLTASQPLAVTSVTPSPATQNANAGYSVKFNTGSAGGLTAGADNIDIVFPSNTFLPTNISKNDITVNSTALTVNPTILGQTMTLLVPVNIGALQTVTVLINQAAGMLNPTLVQSYTLSVATTQETQLQTSPAYNITQTSSTVSAATVTPAVPTPSSQSKYTVNFNTGTNGRLLAGTSTITVTFNASTTVSTTNTDYDSTYIVANSVSTQIPTGNISISGRAVTMIVPTGVVVGNTKSVSIILNRTGATKPIINPTVAGSYTLTVRTSVETSNITSNSYTISSVGPVTNVSATISPDIVNATAQNTVNFTVQNPLAAGSGTVTVSFPFNNFIPTSISTTNVQVENVTGNPGTLQDASAVATNPSARSVTVTVPMLISAGQQGRIYFQNGAGIQSPSIDQNYTLNVRTSAQPLDATSATYALQQSDTQIGNVQTDIQPVAVSVLGQYTFTFTTGARGRMVSGTSTIGIIFPYPYDIAFTLGTPSTSKVKVNGTNADGVSLFNAVPGDADSLIITVPSTATIGNNTGVTVFIDSTAGIRNASSTLSLDYLVYTSVERTTIPGDFSLPVELTSFTAESSEGIVMLNWVTESELQNAYWILERKELTGDEYNRIQQGTLSVYESSVPFKEIARLDGQGNSTEKTTYTYLDTLVQVGRVYAYRIADVSYQGVVSYHEVVYQTVDVPQGFSLSQNYPNPFNPETSIKYNLPVDALVELKIYNILGQVVNVLVDGATRAGFHRVQWNGTNLHQQQVASGIYIYRIQVKTANGSPLFSKVQKMALIR